MFCKNCGTQIKDGSSFCMKCGYRVNMKSEPGEPAKQPVKAAVPKQPAKAAVPKQKKNLGPIVGIAAAVAAVIAVTAGGGLFFYNHSLNQKKEQLCASVETYGLKQYQGEVTKARESWDEIGFTDFDGKKEKIEDIEMMAEKAAQDYEQMMAWNAELQAMDSEKDGYALADNYADYKAALETCSEALTEKDVEKTRRAYEDAKELLDAVIDANEDMIAEKLEQYRNVDLRFADESVKTSYDEGIAVIEKMAEEGDYKGLVKQFETMDELTYAYMQPEKQLNLFVQQIDVSEFPNVKLYVQAEDALTGEVPANLQQMLFYIGKKDANGNYIKQEVTKVNQLNQQEALSVNMVADVSGSMYGSPLYDAKDTMANFINSVQFDAGDRVELISFSTGVYLEREFCSDANLLINDINNLETDDMTSLYDALYTAVTRTAAQTGARCVMAFTDGLDNYSNCDMYNVVEVAQRYRVPIFIIGIGDVDEYEVNYIASETGGEYFHIDDVYSMEEIYKEIYKQQKEMFLVEFVDSSGMSATETADIMIRYQSPEYGGENYQSYTPNVLMNVESDSFFTDGPEAVVEAYMKAFDDAMTYSDFSYIEDYLLNGSPIYTSQSKYVQRDIAETLDTYEIVDTTYSTNDECVVKTRETYFVQKANEPLVLLTQECQYIVVRDNGEWKMKDFADSVKVLSKIKQ